MSMISHDPELTDEIYLGSGVKYSADNFQSGPLMVGDGTVIEKGAGIAPLTIIGNNCRITEQQHAGET